MMIERYSHVIHCFSVQGQLAANKTAYDLMKATFPAGTLSGAPKVRALQIISELENSRRGLYGGALGYFSYKGTRFLHRNPHCCYSKSIDLHTIGCRCCC